MGTRARVFIGLNVVTLVCTVMGLFLMVKVLSLGVIIWGVYSQVHKYCVDTSCFKWPSALIYAIALNGFGAVVALCTIIGTCAIRQRSSPCLIFVHYLALYCDSFLQYIGLLVVLVMVTISMGVFALLVRFDGFSLSNRSPLNTFARSAWSFEFEHDPDNLVSLQNVVCQTIRFFLSFLLLLLLTISISPSLSLYVY